jgi:cathepsin B
MFNLKLIIVGTVAACAAALHPISQTAVEFIKTRNASWETHDPETNPLKDKTTEELMAMCGTWNVPHNGIERVNTFVGQHPDEFDARNEWREKIHAVRDQQGCGSCWAFGATEALSDRFAIHSEGKIDVILSPEDMVSCDATDYGCGGGYMYNAWQYLKNNGVVSERCFPYSAGSGIAPACQATCSDQSESFTKYYCQEPYRVDGVEAIKTELSTNGPLEGAFTVYNDFFNYKSGVYQHVSGGVAGGHAIKVLGYGTENGLPYWLCANSWSEGWGEKGFFKILQGDCDIDSQMYGCIPKI